MTAPTLVALWLSGSPLPPGYRFESVFEPELELDADDVTVCERCEGAGTHHFRVRGSGDSYLDGDVECEARDGGCDGHGLVHGYRGREGMPVRIVEVGREDSPEAAPSERNDQPRALPASGTASVAGLHQSSP